MIWHLILLLGICFAIGGFGVWRVSKRQDAYAARESWRKYVSYLVIVSTIVAVLYYQPQYYFLIALAIAIGGGIEILRGVIKNVRERWPVILIYALFALLFLHYGNDEYMRDDVMMLYTPIVLYDGFSQLCGQLIKGPRLAPKISPEKRISGVIGGICLTTFACAFAYPLSKLFIIAIICILAITGDLLASFLKRRWGIKDYSKLIPGHGGILDRFDSFMFTAAVVTGIDYAHKIYVYGL